MKAACFATFVLCLGVAHAEAETQTKVESAKDPTPPVIKSVDVKRGDQWGYEYRDELTDETKYTISYVVSDLTDNEIDVRVKSRGANGENTTLEIYDRRWRKTEGPRFKFKDNLASTGVPDDPKVGKDWSYDYETHLVDSLAFTKWAGHGEVVAWENVTLPSGKSFDAYKIEFHEATTPHAANQIQIVSAATPSNRRTEVTITEWYAPSVNRYVKRSIETRENGKIMDSTSEVLVSYSRRGTE
jgi:hypothetical protein